MKMLNPIRNGSLWYILSSLTFFLKSILMNYLFLSMMRCLISLLFVTSNYPNYLQDPERWKWENGHSVAFMAIIYQFHKIVVITCLSVTHTMSRSVIWGAISSPHFGSTIGNQTDIALLSWLHRSNLRVSTSKTNPSIKQVRLALLFLICF